MLDIVKDSDAVKMQLKKINLNKKRPSKQTQAHSSEKKKNLKQKKANYTQRKECWY